jgi:hypothetical protein
MFLSIAISLMVRVCRNASSPSHYWQASFHRSVALVPHRLELVLIRPNVRIARIHSSSPYSSFPHNRLHIGIFFICAAYRHSYGREEAPMSGINSHDPARIQAAS